MIILSDELSFVFFLRHLSSCVSFSFEDFLCLVIDAMILFNECTGLDKIHGSHVWWSKWLIDFLKNCAESFESQVAQTTHSYIMLFVSNAYDKKLHITQNVIWSTAARTPNVINESNVMNQM